MPDDRPDAHPELASWLEVEPLDELTRRRMVATAMRESATHDVTPAHRPSRAWRWIAVAAVVVVVLAGGLALLTAQGGHDEEQATRRPPAAVPPSSTPGVAPEALGQAIAGVPDVGDFGDLDDAANLSALRAALAQPRPTTGASKSADSATNAAPLPSVPGCARGVIGTIVAVGRGTIDGRPVTVTLAQGADGKRSIDAFFDDSCETRHLSD
jgi:hypothetical protein